MNENKVYKKSFVLHKDALDVLDELTLEQTGELFLAIRDYQQGVENELSSLIKIVFAPFKAQFIRDSGSYEKVREARILAGRKGGKAKQANVANASNCKDGLANVANLAVSDSDSGSGSDSESESESDRLKDIVQPKPKRIKKPESFKRFFNSYPPNKKGGLDTSAWKKAKDMKLTESDFELMANDVESRKQADPEWFATWALGICKHLDEKIWLTPIPSRTRESQKADFSFSQQIAQPELTINQPMFLENTNTEDFNL